VLFSGGGGDDYSSSSSPFSNIDAMLQMRPNCFNTKTTTISIHSYVNCSSSLYFNMNTYSVVSVYFVYETCTSVALFPTYVDLCDSEIKTNTVFSSLEIVALTWQQAYQIVC